MIRHIYLLLLLLVSLGAQPLTHYARINNIRHLAVQGDTLWCATQGGLFRYNLLTNKLEDHWYTHKNFPDVSLTAVTTHSSGTVWFGSEQGYLTSRSKKGTFATFSYFQSSGASIHQLVMADDLLLVGHSGGLSLFDTKKGSVLYTVKDVVGASAIAVHDMVIVRDSLFMTWESGTYKGVAVFDSVSHNLRTLNFSNPSQWPTATGKYIAVGLNPTNFALHNDSLLYALSGPGIFLDDTLWYGKGDTVVTVLPTLVPLALGFVRTRNGDLYTSYDKVQDITLWNSRPVVAQATGGISLLRALGDSVEFQNVAVGGLQEQRPQRLFVDRASSLWALPLVSYEKRRDTLSSGIIDSTPSYPDWNSVTRFDGATFYAYSSATPGFYSLGDNARFSAIGQGPSGRMYFGNNGSGILVFDGSQWARWVVSRQGGAPQWDSDGSKGGWYKADDLLFDPRGNLWMTNFRFYGVEDSIPSLVVQNEEGTKYRHLFKKDKDTHPPYILAHDSRGNIFAILGTTAPTLVTTNKYLFVDGTKDPYTTTESSLLLSEGTHTFRSALTSATGTSVGSILVGTSGGLDIFRYGTMASLIPLKNYPTQFTSAVTSVVAQQSRELISEVENQVRYETIVWAGLTGVGPVQMRLIEVVDATTGNLVSAEYDTTFTPKIVSFADGLPKRDVQTEYYLSLDSEKKLLWISDGVGGVSSYGIQFEATAATSNEGIKVYPNPFRHSVHSRVMISRVVPGGFVDIYSVEGKLVFHADQNSGDLVTEDPLSWTYQWNVPASMPPGVYYVAAKQVGSTTSLERSGTFVRKLILVP